MLYLVMDDKQCGIFVFVFIEKLLFTELGL